MKFALLYMVGLLSSAVAYAGGPPSEPAQVPIASELGLLGISIILAGYAVRVIARKMR